MPYTKKTLADLQQGLADRHDSGVLPTSSATLTFWNRLLNRGQVYCTNKLRLEKPTSLATTSGAVALPDDFIVANRIYTSGELELVQVDKDIEEAHISGTYWITGNHFDGFTLNVADDDTLTVYYSFRPAEMVNTTDVCIIADPEAVVAFAYGLLRKSETDPIEDADDAFSECDNRLNELMSVENINNNFTGFYA